MAAVASSWAITHPPKARTIAPWYAASYSRSSRGMTTIPASMYKPGFDITLCTLEQGPKVLSLDLTGHQNFVPASAWYYTRGLADLVSDSGKTCSKNGVTYCNNGDSCSSNSGSQASASRAQTDTADHTTSNFPEYLMVHSPNQSNWHSNGSPTAD